MIKASFQPIRWSGDEDRYFGPFTVHTARDPSIGVVFKFSDGDERRESYVRIHLGKLTVLFPIPCFVKPWRQWVDVPGLPEGPGGYWLTGSHEYGLDLKRHEAHWKWGAQKNHWPNGGSGCWFYPWSEQVPVSDVLVHPDGSERPLGQEDACTTTFQVRDFDGEVIEAKVRFERSRYRVGKGLWHWLRLGKTHTYHGVAIEFSAETGRRKGSWKGGVTGVYGPANHADGHEAALQKYCAEHGMTLLPQTPDTPPPKSGGLEND